MSGKARRKPSKHSGLNWERLDWEARIRGDRVRAGYAVVRRLSAPRVWLARRPHGGVAQLEIPRDLGFTILPPDAFPEVGEVVARAQQALAAFQPEAVPDPNKDFFAPIVDASEFARDHPLVRLALRPEILDAVTQYLRCVPLLQDVMLRWSPPIGQATPRMSQLFHCDGEDLRQVKIFVLCSAVGPENGPLQLMDAATSARLRRATAYQYRARMTDERAAGAIGPLSLTPVLGEPGTMCLVDTSRCFHYGSRVEQNVAPRLVANIQYLSPFAFTLPRCVRKSAKFAGLAASESDERERLVLGV